MRNWLETEMQEVKRNDARDPFILGQAYALAQANKQLEYITSIYGSSLVERSVRREKPGIHPNGPRGK